MPSKSLVSAIREKDKSIKNKSFRFIFWVKSTDRYFLEAIHEIKEQGGLAVIPHPSDHMRGSAVKPTESEAKPAEAMEVFNSRCLFEECNEKAFLLARKLRIGMTAGRDVHFAEKIGRAGIATDSDDLRSAIVHADVKVFGKKCSAMSYCRAVARKLLPEESSQENHDEG